ncbi:hypothetical protein [Streptomyces sp. NPDC047070]|uniref:hypothetical protein n=1 Tax=Streptomyces sp. NPDC047070 TaxID=3154923 RepID=UPI00345552A8
MVGAGPNWEHEAVWPRRLHQVAGSNTGTELERWRIVGRDAVTFPEVMAVAEESVEDVFPLPRQLVAAVNCSC